MTDSMGIPGRTGMKRSGRFTRTALLFLPMAAAALITAGQARAADDGAGSAADKPGVITVTGEGTAAKAPDLAILTLTVLREAETAREALDANNAAMGSVLSAMEGDGIAERDMQTSGFSIEPRYFYPDAGGDKAEAPKIVGYQVSNTLSVRIRDLSKVGDILDKSVSLGVNQGGNIVFTNDDPKGAVEEARREAVADAIAKARTLTEAAGVKLGRIREIGEATAFPPPAPMMRAEFAKAAAADASVPVARGENEYRVTVTMSWDLAQ